MWTAVLAGAAAVLMHADPAPAQVVVNFSSSEGPAQEVVAAIKEAGGDAIAVGADISKQEDIDRSASRPMPCDAAWHPWEVPPACSVPPQDTASLPPVTLVFGDAAGYACETAPAG
jgi:hypothetical protein